MRELFEKAASLKPRLIFFDEFELYWKEGGGGGGRIITNLIKK